MAMSQTTAMQLIQRARNLQSRHKASVKTFETTILRKAGVSMTAAAYGAMNRYAVPNNISGFPWKLGVWLGATLVEALADSRVLTAFSAGVSDATMAVYMERAISTKTLVAGEDMFDRQVAIVGTNEI